MKVILLLLALASVCYGRIGATLDECKQMYGEPEFCSKLSGFRETYQARFKQGRITIDVSIVEGEVAAINYWRRNERPNQSLHRFSYLEFKRYRAINGGGRKWKRVDGWDSWETTDGEVSAARMFSQTGEKGETRTATIFVTTPKYNDWLAKELADQ
jgi:hypothetical protein